MSAQIEKFLDTQFEAFYYADGDPTFRAWIGEVIAQVVDQKRAPGCDSDWYRIFCASLAQIDPEIADAALIARRMQADRDENWELADELSAQIKVDTEKAEAAFAKVIAYLLAPR